MSKVGGGRNFGWGKQMAWAGKQAVKSAFAPCPERIKIIDGIVKPRYAMLKAEQQLGV